MKKRKITALVLSLCMVSGMLAGCGNKADEPKSEAEGSGLSGTELNLFTWAGMFPQEVLDGFEEETGIKINYSNFDYDEDMLAKLEEAEGGDYDLIIADDYIFSFINRYGIDLEEDTNEYE